MTAGGSTYYLLYDQVGSLRLITDSNGTPVKKIVYDSFGNILSDSDSSFAIPFGFAGGLHDRDTGLVRFGFRDYMPEIGRWTAKDPILFAGGDSNLYGYVGNDPVNWVDLLGLAPGDLFATLDQAAIDATDYIRSTYEDNGTFEYGGWITKTDDSYTYCEPTKSGKTNMLGMPTPPKNGAGWYHTHPEKNGTHCFQIQNLFQLLTT